MIINSISAKYNTSGIQNNYGRNKIGNNNFDRSDLSFKSGLIYKANNVAEKALEKIPNYSINEYKSLSNQERISILGKYEYLFGKNSVYNKRIEDIHDKATDSIKQHLDNTYGKGKYKLIIIGRSLSSIGKVLGYKIGEENVINIPLSHAGQYLDEDLMRLLKLNGDIDKFRNFLKGKGLEKNEITSSDKKYLIMDYCATGKSLDGATALITRDDVLGKKNIESVDINDCIKDFSISMQLNNNLLRSEFKRLSFVDTAYHLNETESALVNTRQDMEARLTWFKLLDNFMKKEPQEQINQNNKKSFWNTTKDYFKTAWSML